MRTISCPSVSSPWIEPTTRAFREALGSPSRMARSLVPRTECPKGPRRRRNCRLAGAEAGPPIPACAPTAVELGEPAVAGPPERASAASARPASARRRARRSVRIDIGPPSLDDVTIAGSALVCAPVVVAAASGHADRREVSGDRDRPVRLPAVLRERACHGDRAPAGEDAGTVEVAVLHPHREVEVAADGLRPLIAGHRDVGEREARAHLRHL